jgi:hypothetical protein
MCCCNLGAKVDNILHLSNRICILENRKKAVLEEQTTVLIVARMRIRIEEERFGSEDEVYD